MDELKQGDGMRYFGSVVGDRKYGGVGQVRMHCRRIRISEIRIAAAARWKREGGVQ